MGLPLFAGGLALSAIGSIAGGIAANKAAKYNAQVAANNAELSRRQAEDALEQGKAESQQYRLKAAAIRGRSAAAMAANGVDISSGSPLQVLGDQAATQELDALTIENNAKRRAWGFEVQASNFENEAALDKARGKNALAAGALGATSSLLTGAGYAAKTWG